MARIVPDGQDPVSYILSSNIARRHMTKGQRAMAIATIFPEPKAHRGQKSESKRSAEAAGLSARRVEQARTVLRFAPELSQPVLSGALALDEAYATAVQRKRES